MDLNALAAGINAQAGLKSGCLRFWGDWFGKPYDNVHTVLRCLVEGDALVVEFDGGERLTMRNPEGVTANRLTFRVRSATLIRWEWFYYGRAHMPENRYFYEYVRSGSSVTGSTNVDWYKPDLAPSVDQNAVEIL
jgi:hypothetical protein